MNHETKIGLGMATGMFFHAPKGTALPVYPTQYVGTNGDGTNTDTITATSGQTVFTLAETPNAIKSVKVNGVETTAFTLTGSSVTLDDAADTGDVVEVVSYASAWRHVGDISSDGISFTPEKSTELVKNWALVNKRLLFTDHTETVQAPIMDTTEDSLKVVVGASNVTVTPATSEHGKLVNVNLSANNLPEEEAFLFIMKDEDDVMALGCSAGQIQSVEAVSFSPTAAIVWTPTITALGDGFQMIIDDEQSI